MTAKKAKRAARKPSADSSGQERDAKGRRLVRQPHGGALVPGAGGGPQPGAGRPKDSTRELLRSLLRDQVAPNAVKVVAASTDADLHLRAVDMFARVSEGKVEEVTIVSDDVRTRLLRQVEVITRLLPAEQAGPLLRELEAVWS